MDIAALLLWIVTAGAGLYLLAAGRPVTSAEPAAAPAAAEPAEAPAPATVPASRPVQTGIPQAAAEALAAGARVPPITHTQVSTPPGQHPLLEFMHPALGLIGLACWMAYVATKFGTFAWVSFGVLVATIAGGLTWYTVNHRHAAGSSETSGMLETSGAPGASGVLVTSGASSTKVSGTKVSGAGGHRYPPRRILIHGSAAGTTLILALITLLIAVRT
ncbi:MAG TPA: hypothetical protein VG268_13835 [Streptosporangiaceae bacterium]|nr:hypothetical protein [Streptosporangiaceae bacterium]